MITGSEIVENGIFAAGADSPQLGNYHQSMPKWTPTAGALAAYIGTTGSARRNMIVVAEAVGGRFVVEAIGRKGVVVRLTVKRESLREPQPDLFEFTQ
jgi:hypothetical protein